MSLWCDFFQLNFCRQWPSSLLDTSHKPSLRHGVGNSKGVRDVGSVIPGGHPLLLQEAALTFRAPVEMVGGCIIFKFLKYPCHEGRILVLLFPSSFRWSGYLQRKFKSKYFHTYLSLFLRYREGSRRKRKGKINYLLLFVWFREPQCGGGSWFTQLLCKRMERGHSPCQADEEGVSVCKGPGRWRMCVKKSGNKHSILLYGSRDTKCDTRDNCGSNLKAKQLLDIGFGPFT